MPGLSPLEKLALLLRREAPLARQPVREDLMATMRDGRERSFIGNQEFVRNIGDEDSVVVRHRDVWGAAQRDPGDTWLDAHTHPTGWAVPSSADTRFYTDIYGSPNMPAKRRLQMLISGPPNVSMGDYSPSYSWAELAGEPRTVRQLMQPRRYQDARFTLQMQGNKFTDTLNDLGFFDYDADPADALEDLAPLLLRRYDAAQGNMRTREALHTQRYSPGLRDQQVLDAITPSALEILRSKRFARGGAVKPNGALQRCACGG